MPSLLHTANLGDREFGVMNPESEYDGQSSKTRHNHAQALCRLGLELLQANRMQDALSTFQESLQVLPTAEAYTFLGRARSKSGHLHQAIIHCMKAIRLDQTYGEAYQDLGIYLTQLGRLDEALNWLDQAKQATRSKERHLAFLHSGHVFALLGRNSEALAEYVRALELAPGSAAAKHAIAEMTMDFV